MTALPPEVRRAAEPVGVGGFKIGYVTDDGLEHRVSLSQAWPTSFESCSPIRRFTSHKGQRHLSWWSATVGRHMGYESWLERVHVMALDFDPDVVGIASQPFWLFWSHESSGGFRSRRVAGRQRLLSRADAVWVHGIAAAALSSLGTR